MTPQQQYDAMTPDEPPYIDELEELAWAMLNAERKLEVLRGVLRIFHRDVPDEYQDREDCVRRPLRRLRETLEELEAEWE